MRMEYRERSRRLGQGVALIVVLVLAGCAAQPVTRPVQPSYHADSGQAQTDLYFQPGSGSLASGEVERLRRFLAALALRPSDDIVVDVPSTGSPVLDGQRIAVTRSAVGHVPARVRLVGRQGFGTTEERPDAGFVQVIRYDRIRVDCENYGLSKYEIDYLGPIPPIGCANAINRAEMAANKRDLVAPRALTSQAADSAVQALERHRKGATKSPPFALQN